MKSRLFLLLALGAASTSACSNKYTYCHCTTSTGAVNETATMQVCLWEIGIIQPSPGQDWHECKTCDLCEPSFSNCDFREKCTYVESGGQDSNCRE